MAIGIDDEEVETGTAPAAPATTGKFGFAQIKSTLLKSGGSYTKEVKEYTDALNAKLEESPEETSVFVLDRATYGARVTYTYVVLTTTLDGKTAYFTSEIAATGPEGMTPSEAIGALENRAPFILPGIAINGPLDELIQEVLKRNFGSNDLINMDGIVLGKSVNITDPAVAARVAEEALNVSLMEIAIMTGRYSEGSFIEAVREQNAGLVINETYMNTNAQNEFGETRFTTFSLTMNMQEQANRNSLIANTGTAEEIVCNVKGNVQLIPYTAPGPRGAGDELMVAPLICVNTVNTALPTLGMALIALNTAAQLTTERRWVKPLVANLKPGKNPGVVAKLFRDKDGKALQAIDLTANTVSRMDVEKEILTLVQDTRDGQAHPVLAFDIAAFGAGSSQLVPFYLAASSKPEAAAAAKAIITAAHEVTNGAFPLDFSASAIFSAPAVVVPDGVFTTKHGDLSPIDEIDMMYTMSLTGKKSEQINHELMRVELGMENSELGKLRVLDQLNLKALITGNKYRVYFSTAFILELSKAFIAAGVKPRIEESTVASVIDYSYGFASSLVSSGAIQGVQSFHGNQAQVPTYGYGGLMGQRYR